MEKFHRSLLSSIMANKCPQCRQGNLFIHPNPYDLRTTMRMPENCPVCGQKFELQTGFYFGTGFVSYGLTVLFSGVTFALWWFTIGMAVKDNRVLWWLGLNAALLILLQPPIQRLARSVWIALFVRYDKKLAH
jgi:rRNA maturation protein Nop10